MTLNTEMGLNSDKLHRFGFWLLWSLFPASSLAIAYQLSWAIYSNGGYSPLKAIHSAILWPSIVIGAIVAYASHRRWNFIVALAGACLGLLLGSLTMGLSVEGTHLEQTIAIVETTTPNAIAGTIVLLIIGPFVVRFLSFVRRTIRRVF